jgi:hypothetical protein
LGQAAAPVGEVHRPVGEASFSVCEAALREGSAAPPRDRDGRGRGGAALAAERGIVPRRSPLSLS